MSRAQAESVIKNIIREIAAECAAKGQAVSETLVAFMVKAVVLDPNNEFNVDRTLTKDDVQKLIKVSSLGAKHVKHFDCLENIVLLILVAIKYICNLIYLKIYYKY